MLGVSSAQSSSILPNVRRVSGFCHNAEMDHRSSCYQWDYMWGDKWLIRGLFLDLIAKFIVNKHATKFWMQITWIFKAFLSYSVRIHLDDMIAPCLPLILYLFVSDRRERIQIKILGPQCGRNSSLPPPLPSSLFSLLHIVLQ